MKPPLSPSYKFEKEEEGGERLEEEEGKAAPPAVISDSATACLQACPINNRACMDRHGDYRSAMAD